MRNTATTPISALTMLGMLIFGLPLAQAAEPRLVAQAPPTPVYEVEVEVVNVQPRVVRRKIFQPERVCREQRSDYRRGSQGYHDPNHRGHSDACYDGYNRSNRGVTRCYTIERERIIERIDGYEVTYVYNGQELTKQLPYDPGNKLRIEVQASPQVSGIEPVRPAPTVRRPSLTL